MSKLDDLLTKYSDTGKLADIALSEVKEDLAYLNKTANRNMKNLEKSNLTNWAYKMAKTDLEIAGKTKFGLPRDADKKEVVSSMRDVINFLSSKTSNVSGYKRTVKEHIQVFKEHGLDISDVNFNSDEFFNFLASDEWRGQNGFKRRMDSGQAFGILKNVIASDKYTVEDMKRDFQKYVNGEITYDKLEDKYGKSGWIDGD